MTMKDAIMKTTDILSEDLKLRAHILLLKTYLLKMQEVQERVY